MNEYFHSVTLDDEKCKGCTNCIKRCPTEAIRVRNEKAFIINERCIDCGECIRVCPYHAKLATTDSLKDLKKYSYTVALPAPSLYGQYKSGISREKVLQGLKAVGFDDVFEVAVGAEIVTKEVKSIIKRDSGYVPLISSACPAVVRLIQVRFPSLIDNLVKIDSPMEISAQLARNRAVNLIGLPEDEIGVFFISPCAAKVTSIKAPFEREKSHADGAIAMKDIYVETIRNIDSIVEDGMYAQAGSDGVSWACTGGESLSLENDNYLAVDGIHNVLKILEQVENGSIKDIIFIEALACTNGCIGGALTVENSFVAKTRMKQHTNDARKNEKKKTAGVDILQHEHAWEKTVEYKPVMKLDDNLQKAALKLERLEKINKTLPGLDCGACGAPTCRALAEDIVRGMSNETDCIFKLREKVKNLLDNDKA